MPTQTSKRKLKNLSIRVKWSIVILALCIIPLIVSSLFYVNYFKNMSKSESQKKAQLVEELSISRIDEWIQLKVSAVTELINLHPEFQSMDPKVILPFLKMLEESDNQIDNYILVDTKGQGIDITNTPIDVSDRDYFKKMMETKQTVISDMVVSKKTNKLVLPIVTPLLDGSGNIVGAISQSASPDNFSKLTDSIKLEETGYGYIISGSSEYYTYPDKSRIGKKVAEFSKDKGTQDAFSHILANAKGSITYKVGDGKEVITYYETIPNTTWKLLITVPTDEINAAVDRATNIGIIIMLGIILIVSLIAILLTRSVVKPIATISSVVKEVADGNLSMRVAVRSEDEIGIISININNMIDSLSAIVQQINTTISRVASSSEELLESAKQSEASSTQISSAIQEMASGTEVQLQAAEQSARAMEEMAAGVQKIAESSGIVSDQTGEVAKEVEYGYAEIRSAIQQMNVIGTSANHTAAAIEQLNGHSNEIGNIIEFISDISNQTALLSLNASIEAARAGEHGRGFAIVANEVKKLAEQSKESVTTIVELIQSIQQSSTMAVDFMRRNVAEIEDGVGKMQHIGTSFNTIQVSIRQVSEQTQDVSATTEQLSAGTEEITSSLESMVKIAEDSAEKSQTVAASSEEQTAIMEDITASVYSLNEMMSELKNLVKTFKL
ncbi:methyl-accepting chemotaxis protein [Cohnella lupini]|uniref:Methyl-accepting chemotaxis sensory transducer with Cache sensor n=1 Tax=Cohnella lupini TaxID=1294267 RepID=A0A3D9HNT9_9BACL|nr:methyl-accepting chemotaxis protein [Cohnella lupini]RED51160.1 methyl-accepting chemotaxis sensory transducer with Cache sensor [Cohnella lupini]